MSPLPSSSRAGAPRDIEARLLASGIRAADVRESFVRGSGPGGQKINKTSSTVCLRHLPTGLEVRCQRERSQSANRELAWLELCARLEERARIAAVARRDEQERHRRRQRPKPRLLKLRIIASKKRRSRIKARRGRVEPE